MFGMKLNYCPVAFCLLIWIPQVFLIMDSGEYATFNSSYAVLNGSNSNLTLKTFENYTNLNSIGIYRSIIQYIESDTFLRTPDLEILEMGYNERLPALTRNIFLHLENLKTLRLFANKDLFIEPKAFFHLPNLTTLHLINQNIMWILNGMFHFCTNLTELSLANNEIERFQSDVFLRLYNLEILILSRNKLKEIDANTFTTLRKLKELHIDSNELRTISWHHLSGLINLDYLNIANNPIVRLDGRYLHNALPALKRINFRPCNLSCGDEKKFYSYLDKFDIDDEYLLIKPRRPVSACGFTLFSVNY